MNFQFELPKGIETWLRTQDGANVAVNFNSAGADYGYAHVMHNSVVISKITRTCRHCGYDPLWNPDDHISRCGRHSYGPYRYDTVFVWTNNLNDRPLEDCFAEWIKNQPTETEWYKPAKYMDFGKIGW